MEQSSKACNMENEHTSKAMNTLYLTQLLFSSHATCYKTIQGSNTFTRHSAGQYVQLLVYSAMLPVLPNISTHSLIYMAQDCSNILRIQRVDYQSSLHMDTVFVSKTETSDRISELRALVNNHGSFINMET
jgi:hypothetical protein